MAGSSYFPFSVHRIHLIVPASPKKKRGFRAEDMACLDDKTRTLLLKLDSRIHPSARIAAILGKYTPIGISNGFKRMEEDEDRHVRIANLTLKDTDGKLPLQRFYGAALEVSRAIQAPVRFTYNGVAFANMGQDILVSPQINGQEAISAHLDTQAYIAAHGDLTKGPQGKEAKKRLAENGLRAVTIWRESAP